MPIECVAVIGKKNNPLYLSTFPDTNSIDVQHRFQLIAYSSLDIIDDLVKSSEGAAGGDGGSNTKARLLEKQKGQKALRERGVS